jgi:urease accessory protein
MRKTSAFALSLLLATAPAFAHPGHDLPGAGFLAGLVHPLLGADHLLAMLVVGIWAAQLDGRARFWVPVSFLTVMAFGAFCAFNGFTPPRVEAGIAASLMVLGLLCANAWRMRLALAMGVTGTFAFFHGAAHGSELPLLAQPLAFASGFLLATTALHVTGLLIGTLALRHSQWMARLCGVGVLAVGVVYSFA